MHRALAMLLAALALLAPLGVTTPAVASPTLASTTRIPDRLGLSQNRIYGNFQSGTAEAEGHSLFLQRDPSGYRDSVNLYAAFANDPVNNRDPTGRLIPLVGLACAANPVCRAAVSAGVGAVVGARFNAVRQLAVIADDPTKSLSDFSGAQVAASAGAGAAFGAIASLCPGCGAVLATGGAAQSAISAKDNFINGKFRTGAVDALGALGGIWGARQLRAQAKAEAAARSASESQAMKSLVDSAFRSVAREMTPQRAQPTIPIAQPELFRPFHRLPVDPNELPNVRASGELGGNPPRNFLKSDIPAAKAFGGPLPEGVPGYEFYTPAKPVRAGANEWWWRPGQENTREGIMNDENAVFIPIIITKEQ